jgi:hypothetical protein
VVRGAGEGVSWEVLEVIFLTGDTRDKKLVSWLQGRGYGRIWIVTRSPRLIQESPGDSTMGHTEIGSGTRQEGVEDLLRLAEDLLGR